MAEKNVLIIMAEKVDFSSSEEGMTRFLNKAVILENYKGGDLSSLSQIGGCKEIKESELNEELLEQNQVVLLKTNDASQVLTKALDGANRQTLILVVSSSKAAFQGFGIALKLGKTSREAFAKDLAPTICQIVNVPLPPDPTGAVLYQVLKDPNIHSNEIKKAQETVTSLEQLLSRASGTHKHDCA